MTIKLNHTIVHSKDPRVSAEFLEPLFGLPAPKPRPVPRRRGWATSDARVPAGRRMESRCTLLRVPGERYEFDQIFGRIRERKLKYLGRSWAKQEGRPTPTSAAAAFIFGNKDPTWGTSSSIITRRTATGRRSGHYAAASERESARFCAARYSS